MNQNMRTKSLVMVTIAALIWGMSFVWTKQLVALGDSTVVITIRMGIASLLLICFGIAAKKIDKIKPKDYIELLLLATIQPFLYFLFEMESIKQSSPTLISLIMAQVPLVVASISSITSRKRPSWAVIIGIIISIVGVFMLSLGGSDVSLMGSSYGIVMGILAAMCSITFVFLTKKLVSKYSPYTVTAYIHTVAFMFFLPIVLLSKKDELLALPLTVDVIYPLLSLGVLCSAVAYNLYSHGIKILGVSRASMINNLCPAVTAFGAFMLMGDALLPVQIAGIVVSIVGLMLGMRRTS